MNVEMRLPRLSGPKVVLAVTIVVVTWAQQSSRATASSDEFISSASQSAGNNVPFKTSFVSSSDYQVRRNAPIAISMQLANVEPQHQHISELSLLAADEAPDQTAFDAPDRTSQTAGFSLNRQAEQTSSADPTQTSQQSADSPYDGQNQVPRPRSGGEQTQSYNNNQFSSALQNVDDLLAASSADRGSVSSELDSDQSRRAESSATPGSSTADSSTTTQSTSLEARDSLSTVASPPDKTTGGSETITAVAAARPTTTTAEPSTPSSSSLPQTTTLTLRAQESTGASEPIAATTTAQAKESSSENTTSVVRPPESSTVIVMQVDAEPATTTTATAATTTTTTSSTRPSAPVSSSPTTSAVGLSTAPVEGGHHQRESSSKALKQQQEATTTTTTSAPRTSSARPEVDYTTELAADLFASSRQNPQQQARSSNNGGFLVATVPVLDRWNSSDGTSNKTRVVNEFVFVAADSGLTLDDSSYSTRRPGEQAEDPHLPAEHRTIEGDEGGDDDQLDYLMPIDDTDKRKSSASVVAASPQGIEQRLMAQSATPASLSLTTTLRPRSTTLATIVAANRQGLSSSYSVRVSSSSSNSSSTSTSSSINQPNRDAPARSLTTTTTTTTSPTPTLNLASTTSAASLLSASTTTFSPVTSTRRPQIGARLNQKILRLAETAQAVNAGAAQPAVLASTTTTTTTTTTTSTTTRPALATRKTVVSDTLNVSRRQPKQEEAPTRSRHRQFFHEPFGDLRRRQPGQSKQPAPPAAYLPTSNGADEEEAHILTRLSAIPSQLSRLSAATNNGGDKQQIGANSSSSSGNKLQRAVESWPEVATVRRQASKLTPHSSKDSPSSVTKLEQDIVAPAGNRSRNQQAAKQQPSVLVNDSVSTVFANSSEPNNMEEAKMSPAGSKYAGSLPSTREPERQHNSLQQQTSSPTTSTSTSTTTTTSTTSTTTSTTTTTTPPPPTTTSSTTTTVAPSTSRPPPTTSTTTTETPRVPVEQASQRQQLGSSEVMTLIASSLLSDQSGAVSGRQHADKKVHQRAQATRSSVREADEDSLDQYEGSVEDQLAKDALHDRLSSRPTLASNSYGSSAQSKPHRSASQSAAAGAAKSAKTSSTAQPFSDDFAISATDSSSTGNQDDANGGANNQMPGQPGVDYPIHWQVPKTSFDCRNYEQSGFYADVESDCQAYHSCHKGRGGRHTFLCPNGTLFSQELLTCDWWYNVECSASKLYLQPGNHQSAPSVVGGSITNRRSADGSRPNFLSDLMVNLREPLELADIRRHI